MRPHDPRYRVDIRRHELALRLLHYEVRTQTISRWTGLVDERVRSLCRTFNSDEEGALSHRHRGPSPQSLFRILRKSRLRAEAAAAAVMCRAWSVIPAVCVANAADAIPSVWRGENLCAAFDWYRLAFPDGSLSLERLISLVIALSQGDETALGTCRQCGAVILIDRLGIERLICHHCRSYSVSREQREPEPARQSKRAEETDEPEPGYQWSLF